jgi:hypothetical protein
MLSRIVQRLAGRDAESFGMPLHAGPAFRAQRNLVDSETGSAAWGGKILGRQDCCGDKATSAIRTIAAGPPPRSTI